MISTGMVCVRVLSKANIGVDIRLELDIEKSSVSDPHSIYADTDQAFMTNADPDQIPDPD
jgi:hypothetical protein